MHLTPPRARRLAGAAALAALLVAPAVARAHAEVEPSEAARGSTVALEFTIPDERGADDPTARIAIKLPGDAIVPGVVPKAADGWTIAVKSRALAAPVLVDGEAIDSVVDTITYVATEPGATPSAFTVSMGPLPGDADALMFKVAQTYASGAVIRWVQPTPPGGEEPEFPAPTLTLTGEGAAFPPAPDEGATTEEPATTGDAGVSTEAATTEAPATTEAATTDAATTDAATTDAATTAPATTEAATTAPATTEAATSEAATSEAASSEAASSAAATSAEATTGTIAAEPVADEGDDGGFPTGWVILGVVVLAGIGVGVVLLRRRGKGGA